MSGGEGATSAVSRLRPWGGERSDGLFFDLSALSTCSRTSTEERKKKMTVLTVAYERQRRGKFVGLRIPVASDIIDKPDYLPSGHPTPDIPL